MSLLRAVMPMSEWHDWRALALIEAQEQALIRDGVDPRTASMMAWTRTDIDEEGEE